MQAVQGEREISNPGRNGCKKEFKNIPIRFQKAYSKGTYIDFFLSVFITVKNEKKIMKIYISERNNQK